MASDYSEEVTASEKKISFLEHVDTCKVVLFEEIEGETEGLSLWHTVSTDSLEEREPRDFKS